MELGCGTGRVALALASAGFHTTGLDLSQQMLDVFREKLTARAELMDKITLVILEEYSWYDKTPPSGREIIFVCGKKNGYEAYA